MRLPLFTGYSTPKIHYDKLQKMSYPDRPLFSINRLSSSFDVECCTYLLPNADTDIFGKVPKQLGRAQSFTASGHVVARLGKREPSNARTHAAAAAAAVWEVTLTQRW